MYYSYYNNKKKIIIIKKFIKMASITNNLLTPTNLLLEAEINHQIIKLVSLLQESNDQSIMVCTPGPKSIGKTFFNL